MPANRLNKVSFDISTKIILGTGEKINKKAKPVIFLGTNVSGKLHLGHLVLLSISDYLSKNFKTKIVVSLNEIESVYARNNNLKQVLENRKLIIDFLTKQGISIHSRIEDYDLLLLATRLIKILESDKTKFNKLQSFYSKKLNPSQIFEIVLMAVAPAFVANEQKAKDILLVYGADQQNHLEYIYDLYKQAWFKGEVKGAFGFSLPKLNYLVIRLIPNLLANSKMSKSKNKSTISFDQIKSDTRLTSEIVEYLSLVIEIMAPLESSTKNPWLNYINTLIF